MGEQLPRALIETARPEYWISFLEPYATFCARHGLALDARAAQRERDKWYRALQNVIRAEDAARPEALRASSKRIAHIADEGGRERIVTGLRRRGLDAELTSERRTDLELALAIFERHPAIFEEAVLRKQAAARDNFWEFLPAHSRPALGALSADVEAILRAETSQHHYGYGHTAYCDLDVEINAHEVRLVFSRGNAHRSHGIVNGRERREQIDYTPEHHDVAVIDRATGRLGLSINKLAHVEFTRQLLGRVLFGDREHYRVAPIYTGAPLLERGEAALSVRGISGLKEVVLRTIALRRPDGRTRSLGTEEGSIFPEDAHYLDDFAQEGCVVTSMRFDLRYGSSSRFRPLEIHPPNHIIFDRQIAEHAVREFLVTRGFAHYGDEHFELAA